MILRNIILRTGVGSSSSWIKKGSNTKRERRRLGGTRDYCGCGCLMQQLASGNERETGYWRPFCELYRPALAKAVPIGSKI
jgi:hypothetical protein